MAETVVVIDTATGVVCRRPLCPMVQQCIDDELVVIRTTNNITGNGGTTNPLGLRVSTAGLITGTGTDADPVTIAIQTNGGVLSGSGTLADPFRVDIRSDNTLLGDGTTANLLRVNYVETANHYAGDYLVSDASGVIHVQALDVVRSVNFYGVAGATAATPAQIAAGVAIESGVATTCDGSGNLTSIVTRQADGSLKTCIVTPPSSGGGLPAGWGTQVGAVFSPSACVPVPGGIYATGTQAFGGSGVAGLAGLAVVVEGAAGCHYFVEDDAFNTVMAHSMNPNGQLGNLTCCDSTGWVKVV